MLWYNKQKDDKIEFKDGQKYKAGAFWTPTQCNFVWNSIIVLRYMIGRNSKFYKSFFFFQISFLEMLFLAR